MTIIAQDKNGLYSLETVEHCIVLDGKLYVTFTDGSEDTFHGSIREVIE